MEALQITEGQKITNLQSQEITVKQINTDYFNRKTYLVNYDNQDSFLTEAQFLNLINN